MGGEGIDLVAQPWMTQPWMTISRQQTPHIPRVQVTRLSKLFRPVDYVWREEHDRRTMRFTSVHLIIPKLNFAPHFVAIPATQASKRVRTLAQFLVRYLP